MQYLDTSLLVAALTNEGRTKDVQEWLGGQHPDELGVSDWVITEFSSALSLKERSGQIEAPHRADALSAFIRLCRESFTVLPVSRAQFRLAARFLDQYRLGLRSGDALHLAICGDEGLTLATLDRRLGEAAAALGVKTVLL